MFCSRFNMPLPVPGGLSLLLSLIWVVAPSAAHEAPTGWSYPYACCSGFDCREVGSKMISERPEGYVIGTTGEVVAYSDKRVKNSPDGEYHWCSIAGSDNTRTICLFVPTPVF